MFNIKFNITDVPFPIKVVAYRPEGVTDCAEDTKLSLYGLGYYYTFLHEEAVNALQNYIEARIRNGWQPNSSDRIFVTHGKFSNGRPLTDTRMNDILKGLARNIGIPSKRICMNLLRKLFRKSLYKGGVDPDVAEALMGHKLPNSRGNYFDYADLTFVKREYMKGMWHRADEERVRSLEEEVKELREEIKLIQDIFREGGKGRKMIEQWVEKFLE